MRLNLQQLLPSPIPFGACATRRSDPFWLFCHGYSKDAPTKVGTDIHSPLFIPHAEGDVSRPSEPCVEGESLRKAKINLNFNRLY